MNSSQLACARRSYPLGSNEAYVLPKSMTDRLGRFSVDKMRKGWAVGIERSSSSLGRLTSTSSRHLNQRVSRSIIGLSEPDSWLGWILFPGIPSAAPPIYLLSSLPPSVSCRNRHWAFPEPNTASCFVCLFHVCCWASTSHFSSPHSLSKSALRSMSHAPVYHP